MTTTPKDRIRLIEGEPLIGMLIEEMLAELGYETVRASADLRSAVETTKKESFEIALVPA